MKTVRFHAAAREELLTEVLYYAKISPRLGEGLAAAIEQATRLAAEFPETGSSTQIRHSPRFPEEVSVLNCVSVA